MRKNKEDLKQQAKHIIEKIQRNRAKGFNTDALEDALNRIRDLAQKKNINLKEYSYI